MEEVNSRKHRYEVNDSMKIPLKQGKEIYLIEIGEIQYLDIYKKVISVYTSEQTFQTLSTLSDWYIFLREFGFERLSQSSIVNMNKIETFDSETNRVFFNGCNSIFHRCHHVGVSIPNIPKIKNYIKNNK